MNGRFLVEQHHCRYPQGNDGDVWLCEECDVISYCTRSGGTSGVIFWRPFSFQKRARKRYLLEDK